MSRGDSGYPVGLVWVRSTRLDEALRSMKSGQGTRRVSWVRLAKSRSRCLAQPK